MKKLLLLLFVVGIAFTACNNTDNNDYSDTTATGVDNVGTGVDMTDTMNTGMDTTNMGAGVLDTTGTGNAGPVMPQ